MKANFRFAALGFLGATIGWWGVHSGPAIAQNVKVFIVRLQDTTPGTPQTGHANITGTIIAGQHVGGGAGLTGLNGSNIATGTVNDNRLSANVAMLNDSQTFTGFNSFASGLSTNSFRMDVGAAAGEVLKTDSNGIGTWLPDSWTMPFTDSVAGTSVGLGLTHTGTGDLAIFTMTDASGVGEAVQGVSNNGGDVFQATMSGLGRAGYFAITHGGSTNNAVHALTSGPGTAVMGSATHATAINYGGRFLSSSFDGYGVYGQNSSSGYGGYFRSSGGTALAGQNFGLGLTSVGVFGGTESSTGRAVYGYNYADTGTSYGVYGLVDSNNGYGVYSNGDFGAGGTKSFRIDHPFDPLGKYLLHYCTESPVPQNFYVGNVVTDAKGYAWVELPDYFAEINKNFKYQLTVVDDQDSDGFVMAKVSKKIRGTRFQVRTSAPNVEVSWRVDADRNDRHVRARMPKDVIEKPELERGKYQNPKLYGAGPEQGMDYRQSQRVDQPLQ